ncbi:MAG: hypothetical protein HPY75_03790 [Actinobacteria bacterium]|nr:hypothetical protein [Actinomycetota bacterium]
MAVGDTLSNDFSMLVPEPEANFFLPQDIIDHLSQLSAALEKLLKWTLQYGHRGKARLPRGLERALNLEQVKRDIGIY